jgi:drug/metabolite transporter (DMT)-like permease
LAALLYAGAHLPTLITLSDPTAGPNPLIVMAALACGIVWSFAAVILKRLPPVIFSHMAFTYFTAVQFRWPGT